MRRILLLIIFLLLSESNGLFAEKLPVDNDLVSTKLNIVKGSSSEIHKDVLENISLSFEAKKIQFVKDGLKFNVVINNSSHETAYIEGIDELCYIQLLNEEGWPVSLPRKPSYLSYKRMGKKKKPNIFKVMPNSEERVEITIKEILADSKKYYSEIYGTAKTFKKKTVTPGKYKARVYCVLIVAFGDITDRYKALSLFSDYISVSLLE